MDEAKELRRLLKITVDALQRINWNTSDEFEYKEDIKLKLKSSSTMAGVALEKLGFDPSELWKK